MKGVVPMYSEDISQQLGRMVPSVEENVWAVVLGKGKGFNAKYPSIWNKKATAKSQAILKTWIRDWNPDIAEAVDQRKPSGFAVIRVSLNFSGFSIKQVQAGM